MTIRRFNFTHRKRIPREKIGLTVHANESISLLDISVDLADQDLPDGAKLYVEAYRPSTTQRARFSLGAVRQQVRQAGLPLREFESIDDLLFSLKVVDEGQRHGVLLAYADSIQPERNDRATGAGGESLLAVVSEDLDGVLWKLDFYEERYVLTIERSLGLKEAVVRNPVFRALVMPAAFREILFRIVLGSDIEWAEELDEDSDNPTRWIHFASRLGCGMPPRKAEDADSLRKLIEWVDSAVSCFSKKMGQRDECISQLSGGPV